MPSPSTAPAAPVGTSPTARRPRTRTRLVIVSTTLLGLTSIGAATALTQDLPDGAIRSAPGGDAWGGFIHGSGTAMSPPLPVMILFMMAILLAASRWRIGMLGAIALAIGGAAFTAGMLIEPITSYSLTSGLDVIKTPLVALAILAAPLTTLAAAAELRYRMRPGQTTASMSEHDDTARERSSP